MEGRTFLGNWAARHSRKTCLFLLVLLGLATVCPAQQQGTRDRRRPTRGSRGKTIQLPDPVTTGAVSLEQAITKQQTVTLPGDQRLKFSDLGQVAWAAQGAPVPMMDGRAVPDDDNPIKIYFALPDGIYLYGPGDHALEQTSDRDVRVPLAQSLLNQQGGVTGGCQIVIAGSSRSFAPSYGVKARTVMWLLAGQMTQSIQLQAVSLGLTFVTVNNVDAGNVRKTCRLPRDLEPLCVVMLGYPAGQAPQTVTSESSATVTRRAVFITPPQGYRDDELLGTKRALELASMQTVVASTRLGGIIGTLGQTVQVDLMLRQVRVADFDAVIFIGGVGAVDLLDNSAALELARQAVTQRKILAASGTAPAILANAGVLRGARATSYLSEGTRLTQAGATYTGNPVERDGTLVTSTGPLAVQLFATTILEAVAGN